MSVVPETSDREPWAKYYAKPYEWKFSEDSFERSLEKKKPVQIYKFCQYNGVEKDCPIWSIDNPNEPVDKQDIAVFASAEGDTFKIAKRLVILHGQGRWNIGDFVTLHVRGCCNIVNIIEQ